MVLKLLIHCFQGINHIISVKTFIRKCNGNRALLALEQQTRDTINGLQYFRRRILFYLTKAVMVEIYITHYLNISTVIVIPAVI